MSLFALAVRMFRHFRRDSEVSQTFFTATTDKNRPLSKNPYFRLGALGLMSLLMVILVMGGLQVYPVFEPYAESVVSPSKFSELWLMSVPVGPTEDYVFSLLLPSCLVYAMWMAFWLFTRKDLKDNILMFTGAIIIASAVASFGLVGMYELIPNFAYAHTEAYQVCESCYWSAGIFNFLMSLLQQLTGMFFFGIPHIIHNLLLGIGFFIGGALLLIMPVPGGTKCLTKYLRKKHSHG